MRYRCPVCYYPDLEETPERFSICPACGTEFGTDDFVSDPSSRPKRLWELRMRWLAAGAPWFDEGTPRPSSWSPLGQQILTTSDEPVSTGTEALSGEVFFRDRDRARLLPVELRSVA